LAFGAVNLIGGRIQWSVTLILVAMFFGFYLNRVSYFFLVVGVTVMVS
jgi:hypothetical protein